MQVPYVKCTNSSADLTQGCAMGNDSEKMSALGSVQLGVNATSLLSPLTGIGQYTFHLVRELQQSLHCSPQLFYGTGWQQDIRDTPVRGMGLAKKIVKRIVPHPYMVSRFLQQRRFSAGIDQHGIQLYHEPNFMAYRFNGPSVVTVHDLSWVRYPETHPPERVRIMNQLMPKTVRQASHILVDSEFVRREVMDYYGVSPDRVTTTLLGVTSDFKPLSAIECDPVLKTYGLRYGEYILAVGTLEPRKNLSTVIAAFSQLPDAVRRQYPLVIVGMNGWGMDRFPASLRQMISRGEAYLTGYVPRQDLPVLYAAARLFVYPSLYEGFGLPPLEAMACGTPVVTSNRASLPEVVGDAGILTEPLDDKEIARNMLVLLEDDVVRGRLSDVGRQRASAFTWRKCALETVAVYQKALAG